MIYEEKNPPIITEDKRITTQSLLQTALLDEIVRLRKCFSRKERNEIRMFILNCSEALEKNQMKDENQAGVQESKLL